MAKILVTYFSRTGSTEAVARALAEKLGADLDVIHPLRSYDGASGYMRAILQSVRRSAPIFGSDKRPGDYSLVVVGAPVWAGRLAGPMRGYLGKHAGAIRALAAFCVSGSGGQYEAFFREVEQLAGKPASHHLALSERAVRDGSFQESLTRFATALQVACPPPVAAPERLLPAATA